MSKDGMSKDGRKMSPMHVTLKAGVSACQALVDFNLVVVQYSPCLFYVSTSWFVFSSCFMNRSVHTWLVHLTLYPEVGIQSLANVLVGYCWTRL